MSLRSISVMRADAEAAVEGASPTVPDAGDAQTKLTDQLIALVPTEAIALYVVLIGVFAKEAEKTRWASFVVVLVFTVGWVIVSYWEKQGGRTGIPWLEVVVGVVAYVAWTTTVPLGTWSDLGGSTAAGAGIVAVTSALLVGVVRAKAIWATKPPTPAPAPEPGPAA